MMKNYEEMSKALAGMNEESFEMFLTNFNDEEKEMFCKMRSLYKLMADKKFYNDVQNAVAKEIWKEAQAV